MEVFTASATTTGELNNGYLTHLLKCEPTFEGDDGVPKLAGEAFARRHAEKPFDVLEGADFWLRRWWQKNWFRKSRSSSNCTCP